MLNNHQKHFVKSFKHMSYFNGREIDERQVSEEVAYLSRIYDVKFSNHMSWISPYCVFNGVDFGRFHIRMSTKYEYYLLHHPKHKHPHSWPDHAVSGLKFGEKHYNATCFGNHIHLAFISGRLIDAYRMYNHTIQNIGTDAEITSKYNGPDIIEFCHNFNLKKYDVCEQCRSGCIVEGECTCKDCSRSPYYDYDDYEEDDDYDDYE